MGAKEDVQGKERDMILRVYLLVVVDPLHFLVGNGVRSVSSIVWLRSVQYIRGCA